MHQDWPWTPGKNLSSGFPQPLAKVHSVGHHHLHTSWVVPSSPFSWLLKQIIINSGLKVLKIIILHKFCISYIS